MNDREKKLYEQIRQPPTEECRAAVRAVLARKCEGRAQSEYEALRRTIDHVDPVHEAMRNAMAGDSRFAEVLRLTKAPRVRPHHPVLPSRPVGPPAVPGRLKLGSFDLLIDPPFVGATWQQVQTGGGITSDGINSVTELSSDGTSMSIQIAAGDLGSSITNCLVSCMAAVYAVWMLPADLTDFGSPIALANFGTAPSFDWSVQWDSSWWRLAAGNVWIGQFVEALNPDFSPAFTLFSYQDFLMQWHDHNLVDYAQKSGQTTAYALNAPCALQPGFWFAFGVWIGANAFGDNQDSGSSGSTVTMSASVPWISLVDSF